MSTLIEWLSYPLPEYSVIQLAMQHIVQFWPSGIVITCVSVCVRVYVFVSLCVNHLLVRTITRDPFKLESPNLDQRCKRPWLGSLLFWRAIDLDLQDQISLKSLNLPQFELVHTITHYPFKLGSPNSDQRWKISWSHHYWKYITTI